MNSKLVLSFLLLLSLSLTSQAQFQSCTQTEWAVFLSRLQSDTSCGQDIMSVLQFVTSDSENANLLDALDSVCNVECGGEFANFLKSSCNDSYTAKLLELYCTYTNESSTLGPYCRSTALDVFNKTLLRGLFLCHPIMPGKLCSPVCKTLLLEVKAQLGCCFQSLYNNSVILDNLLNTGLLPIVQYYGLQRLREPTFNVWMVCNVPPPLQCIGKAFSSMVTSVNIVRPPSNCALDYVFTLPHADVCGVSLGAAFQPSTANASIIINDLENVCNSDCGGNYVDHLESTCKDSVTAETLQIICTPSYNHTAVGPFCRFAFGALYDQSYLGTLFAACSNLERCLSECRSSLLRLKSEIGCCYQSIYNNTYFLNETFNAGLITSQVFFSLQNLGRPTFNPWITCDIDAPYKCAGDPFPRSQPAPVCSLDNWVAFISQLPNGIQCGPHIATIFSPPTNIELGALTQALSIVCTSSCGGQLYQYLKTTCNDLLSSKLLEAYCTPTFRQAEVSSRCRFASPDILQPSIISNLEACYNSTADECSFECRDALRDLTSTVGCCYQLIYNDSVLLSVLLNAGFITSNELQVLEYLRSPSNHLWTVCNVLKSQECSGDPFNTNTICQGGTYKVGSDCYYCPANSNTTTMNMPSCPCLLGFFRTSEEGASNGCSPPPSSCRDLGLMNKTDQQVALAWKRPVVTGRDDFYYVISYSDGDTTAQYSLQSTGHTVKDIISGLTPATTYIFKITVHNGVSSQDKRNTHLRQCELTTRTMEGSPSAPLDVQGFCKVVGWKIPDKPNGKLLSYDLHLYTPPSEEGPHIFETVKSDQTYFALTEDLLQQQNLSLDRVIVQVRGRTAAGPGKWSSEVLLGCGRGQSCMQPEKNSVYFLHMGHRYGNNSELSLDSIGEGDRALICKTNKIDCCDILPNRFGEFYYPTGTQVPINKIRHGFYRNRGHQEVYLNKRLGINSPVGVFCCVIPDSSEKLQKICISLL